jgi:ribosomal protein L37AE/L43A
MDGTLRGSRLGATSYEQETREVAERHRITFHCAQGHATEVAFAADADLPSVWECRTCGGYAARRGASIPEPRQPVRPIRTPFDMLMERRTRDDLEDLLAERLEVLRATGGTATPHTDHRMTPVDNGRRRKSA